jgi:hypothetical protein
MFTINTRITYPCIGSKLRFQISPWCRYSYLPTYPVYMCWEKILKFVFKHEQKHYLYSKLQFWTQKQPCHGLICRHCFRSHNIWTCIFSDSGKFAYRWFNSGITFMTGAPKYLCVYSQGPLLQQQKILHVHETKLQL